MFHFNWKWLESGKGCYVACMYCITPIGKYFVMEDEDSVTGRWFAEFHESLDAEWWHTADREIAVKDGPEEGDVLARIAAEDDYISQVGG